MSRLARALCAALIAVLLCVDTPPAHGAESDWRLLYAGGELLDGTGALKSNIPANISIDFPAARFSRDGTRLAVPDSETVKVHKPDGTSVQLAEVPDFYPTAVAWSSDGSKVAALGEYFTPEDNDIRIYLFPVNGAPASLVYSDTQILRVFKYGGLSWNPVDNRLAFIATEFEREGSGPYFSVPGGSDQVWTVEAEASAVPSRFTGRPVCGDCSDTPGYREPAWSPDGSRLAVESFVPFDEDAEPFVGYLDEGAPAADHLVDAVPRNQLAWSHDGERLAFGIPDTTGDFYDETLVVDADTGAALTTIEHVIAPFVDWLPCPTGTCQVWQNVYVPLQPFMNIRGKAKGPKVIASGELGHVPEVTDVRVTLQKRARPGARWRKVTTVEVRAVEGLFRKSFPRPNATQCRVVGVYTDGDLRASDSATFSC